MNNIRCILLITILLFYSLPTFSQLSILSTPKQRALTTLNGLQIDLCGINHNTYALIGAVPKFPTKDIVITEIDTTFDPLFRYLILYPIRSYEMSELTKYGTILQVDQRYLIFKTKETDLSHCAEFYSFHRVQITTGNTMPLFRDFEAEAATQKAHSYSYRADIQKLVDAVSEDSLWAGLAKVVKLERHANKPEAKQGAEALQTMLKQYKFDEVILQDIGSTYSPNIIATKYGTTQKDSIYIIGGHYDIVAATTEGADDNGSGTVITLEAARVLSQVTCKKTVVFVLFSAEEVGFVGSAKCAALLSQEKKKVGGFINIDVALYRNDNKPFVEIAYDDRSKELFTSYNDLSKKYQPAIPTADAYKSPYKSSSDNKSFWDKGFRAIMVNGQLISSVNPNMHKSTDVMTAANYCKQELVAVTRASVAALATWAEVEDGTPIAKIEPNTFLNTSVTLSVKQTSRTLSLHFSKPYSGFSQKIRLISAQGKEIASQPIAPFSQEVTFTHDSKRIGSGIYYIEAAPLVFKVVLYSR